MSAQRSSSLFERREQESDMVEAEKNGYEKDLGEGGESLGGPCIRDHFSNLSVPAPSFKSWCLPLRKSFGSNPACG